MDRLDNCTKNKKVLFITFYFPPVSNMASIRNGKLMKYLSNFGWNPIVLTPECIPGYSKTLPVEIKTENIIRAPYLLYDIERDCNQSRNHLLFFLLKKLFKNKIIAKIIYRIFRSSRVPDRAIFWYSRAFKKGLEIVNTQKIDLIISSSNPPTIHMIGRALHKKTGIPWVAEFQDRWSFCHYEKRSLLLELLEQKLEKMILKNCAALITVSKPWADELRKLHKKNTYVVHTGYDPSFYASSVKLREKFTITYTGNVVKEEMLPFLKAIMILKKTGKISQNNMEVRFYGWLGSLGRLTKYYDISDIVSSHSFVPWVEAVERQRESSILLVLGWSDNSVTGCYTEKIFEYIGTRRPILAITYKNGIIDSLLKECGIGFTSNVEDEIADLITRWMDEFYSKGMISYCYGPQNDVIRTYSSEVQASKLANIFNNLVEIKDGQN